MTASPPESVDAEIRKLQAAYSVSGDDLPNISPRDVARRLGIPVIAELTEYEVLSAILGGCRAYDSAHSSPKATADPHDTQTLFDYVATEARSIDTPSIVAAITALGINNTPITEWSKSQWQNIRRIRRNMLREQLASAVEEGTLDTALAEIIDARPQAEPRDEPAPAEGRAARVLHLHDITTSELSARDIDRVLSIQEHMTGNELSAVQRTMERSQHNDRETAALVIDQMRHPLRRRILRMADRAGIIFFNPDTEIAAIHDILTGHANNTPEDNNVQDRDIRDVLGLEPGMPRWDADRRGRHP